MKKERKPPTAKQLASRIQPGGNRHLFGGPPPTPKVLTGEQLIRITALAANGVRRVDIARACGVSSHLFGKICERQPEVAEAYAAGDQMHHDGIYGNLMKAGKKGNIVADMFMLKTRFGYREGDALPTVGGPQVIINMPGAQASGRVVEGQVLLDSDLIDGPG